MYEIETNDSTYICEFGFLFGRWSFFQSFTAFESTKYLASFRYLMVLNWLIICLILLFETGNASHSVFNWVPQVACAAVVVFRFRLTRSHQISKRSVVRLSRAHGKIVAESISNTLMVGLAVGSVLFGASAEFFGVDFRIPLAIIFALVCAVLLLTVVDIFMPTPTAEKER